MPETKAYVYCPRCSSMTQPYQYPLHFCTKYEKGVKMDTLRKRWDSTLKCWVLDDPPREDVRAGSRYYDGKTNTWIDMDGVGHKDTEAGLQSCGISYTRESEKKELGPGTPGTEVKHGVKCTCFECRPKHIKYHTDRCLCNPCEAWKKEKGIPVYNYDQWKPVRPYEGVDRAKWPNTYMHLVKLYFAGNDWYQGKTIPDHEYRARILEKKYAPEPKYPKYYSDWQNAYGNDWENNNP